MRPVDSRQRILAAVLGVLPTVWLALLAAPYLSGGLPQLIAELPAALNQPFQITFTQDTPRCVLLFLLVYGTAVCCLLTNERSYRRREEHGSAKWGDPAAIDRKYRDRRHPEENALFTQHIAMRLDCRRTMRNLNVVVVGGSGSGKTRFYCLPNLMQCSRSFIVLDPKGEQLRSTGRLLEAKGYRVRVLNLIDMASSFCYNPFVYLRDDNDIQRLVTNLFKNTTPKDSKPADPFWDQAAEMLLMALVLYLHYEAPPEEQNFAMVMEMVRAADVNEDMPDYQSLVDELFERLAMRDPDHIALKYYRNYRCGSAKTLKSIQITLVSHLEKFNLQALADLTRTDELELPRMGEEKTVLYCVIPDNDGSFNFIVGMLYTQLFQQLYYQADFVHGGALPVPVHFLMDEFANVALPDEFDKLLATMRSRNISVSIVLQNISQLKALFEKQWESIMGNCDEFLYLGGNEQSSHEYVSKLLGKATIDLNTYGQSKGRSGSYSTNWQLSGRELLMPDEVRQLDNRYALLFIRGERPVMDLKFDTLRHPNVKQTTLGGAPPYDARPPRQTAVAAAQVWDEQHPPAGMDPDDAAAFTNEELELFFEQHKENIP